MTAPEPYIDDPDFRLYIGDVREKLVLLPDESIDCCITSPPYLGLRDYGTGTWEGGNPDHDHETVPARNGRGGSGTPGKQTEGAFPSAVSAEECSCGARRVDQQIGLEETPDAYIAAIVEVFREVRRVLTQYGTLWLNLGDSYASDSTYSTTQSLHDAHGWKQDGDHRPNVRAREVGLKAKDLVMIPARVALALQADGWYIRSDIIWSKANPMPESVTDRPTKSHEFVFLLAKSERYYFDQEAVREAFVSTHGSGNGFKRDARLSYGGRGNDEQWRPPIEETPHVQPTLDGTIVPEQPRTPDGRKVTTVQGAGESLQHRDGERWPNPTGRNVRTVWEIAESTEDAAVWLAEVFAEAMRAGDDAVARTVWEIATKPYKGAHFATYPPELVRRCLLAGCPPEVCVHCGRPRERITAKTTIPTRAKPLLPEVTGNGDGRNGRDSDTFGNYAAVETIGWTECGCAYGLPPDSMETIETPIGTVGEPDPTLDVGRKGLARPRSEDEGTRLITRHEQRGYAAQLREWSDAARSELLSEFGISETAWAHYVRTDRSGGRPLPADVLDACLERGWLDPVVLPDHIDGTYRPGVVLDPFMGSGTTALVARDHSRHAVGIELNPEYAALCARRVSQLSLLSSSQ